MCGKKCVSDASFSLNSYPFRSKQIPSERRFLFSTLYGANPFEDYPGKKNNSWECCQELAGQLLELLILDRMLHGVDTVYHPTNKVPPFSKSHLIDFGFDGQTYFLKNQDHEYKTNHLIGLVLQQRPNGRQDTLAALCRLNASYYWSNKNLERQRGLRASIKPITSPNLNEIRRMVFSQNLSGSLKRGLPEINCYIPRSSSTFLKFFNGGSI